MAQHFTDDADADEVEPEPGSTLPDLEDLDSVDPEVPEADALDQHRPIVDERVADAPRSIPPDVPEADALDQSIPAPVDDDRWDE